jgi:hypothetical protein
MLTLVMMTLLMLMLTTMTMTMHVLMELAMMSCSRNGCFVTNVVAPNATKV